MNARVHRRRRRGRSALLAGAALALLTLAGLAGGRNPAHSAPDEGFAPLVRIPGGPTRLGSDDRQKGYGYVLGGPAAWEGRWFQNERERTEDVPAFDLEATLVTQAAYARFVAATGHRVPFISAAEYRAQGFLVHPYTEVRDYLWRDGRPPPGKARHPVVLVSQGDAQAYCRWRGARTGRTCRLPREAEWEKAARGAEGRVFPWGDAWAPEWLNTQARGPWGTTPVDAYPAGRSPYGLYDMAGNVFQWTATPGAEGEFVLKGCSWDDRGGICRAAARHDRPAVSRHILIGFRCACDRPDGGAPQAGAARR